MKLRLVNVGRGLMLAVVGGAAITALVGTVGIASAKESKKKLEMTFDLSKCEQQAPNLYKCPAIDKPICTKDFSQPDVECVHVGKKGSVFVMMPGGTTD